MRRLTILLLVMGMLLGNMAAALGQETAAPLVEVTLLTPASAPVQPGSAAWVVLNWTATGGDAWDFRVTAQAAGGATVDYPTNTGDHSSLFFNDRLSDGEIDFTALRVTVPPSAVGPIDLDLTVTYQTSAGPGSTTTSLGVVLLGVDGEGLDLLTDDLGSVDQNTTTWVDVWFAGLAPVVGDVQLAVSDDAGLGIVYPFDGSFASLYYQSELAKGETDVARVRVDTTGVAPGTYKLGLTTTFVAGGTVQTLEGSATIVVVESIDRRVGNLAVSGQADRSASSALPGAELRRGAIAYVFLDTPSRDIDTVTFFLDGRKVKTEVAAPYDFLGTRSDGSAAPWSTRRYRGDHTIRADVVYRDGTTDTVSATFTFVG